MLSNEHTKAKWYWWMICWSVYITIFSMKLLSFLSFCICCLSAWIYYMLSIPMILVDDSWSVYNIQDNKIKQRSHLDLSAPALKENRLYNNQKNTSYWIRILNNTFHLKSCLPLLFVNTKNRRNTSYYIAGFHPICCNVLCFWWKRSTTIIWCKRSTMIICAQRSLLLPLLLHTITK